MELLVNNKIHRPSRVQYKDLWSKSVQLNKLFGHEEYLRTKGSVGYDIGNSKTSLSKYRLEYCDKKGNQVALTDFFPKRELYILLQGIVNRKVGK
jgi:hypothetical protein